MIRSSCPTCHQPVLAPDPEPNTKEQNIAFRKEWDARYEEAQRNNQCPTCLYRFEDAKSLEAHLNEGRGCPEAD